ncbi:MAG: LLM class flavin-dependent oxidoreductase [Microthrixaceae bacterium]
MEFHVFLPQMRLSLDDLVARARAAERAGLDGIALMDHLAPPMAEDKPMWEAMTAATWLAARTERLTVGHLVLCDAFRHPAVLARQVVTLDHASGGRFELGLGSGSVPDELDTFGLEAGTARGRVEQLGRTLELLEALWSGEPLADDVAAATGCRPGALQLPVPTRRIPVTIGGTGPRTMALVARFADWWNLPVHQLDRLEELRPAAGSARVSVQVGITFVPAGADRDAVVGMAEQRFGWMRRSTRLVGGAGELTEQLAALEDRGVERVYGWFTDFAPPATLEAFGAEVLAP